MSGKIVLESSADILDSLRAKITEERYWLAGTIVGVIAGSLLPWEQVRVFSVFAGGAFFVLVFVEMIYSIRHEDTWHKARESAYRKQNGLPLPEREWVNIVPEPAVVKVVHTVTAEGGARTTINEYNAKQLPTRELIEWLFANADKDGGIPSEADTFAKFTASANLMLDTLVAEHIIEKVGEYVNAPRRICAGVTEADALGRFGYPPTPPINP